MRIGSSVLLFVTRLLAIMFLGVAAWWSLVDNSALAVFVWILPVMISDLLILVSCIACRRSRLPSPRPRRTASKRSRRHPSVSAPGRRRVPLDRQRSPLPAAPICPGCRHSRLSPSPVHALPASNNHLKGTILDSGATSHLFSSKAFFDVKTLRPSSVKIHLAEQNRYVRASHCGDALIRVYDSSGSRILRLRNALLVPQLPLNLVSLSCLDKLGCRSVSERGQLRVERHNALMLIAYLSPDRLYQVSVRPANSLRPHFAHLADSHTGGLPEVDLMHRRLGHCSLQYLRSIAPRFSKSVLSFCDACAQAKSVRRPFKHAHVEDDALKPLDKVTADLCGPMETESISRRKRYFAAIVDVATRYVWVYCLRRKNDFSKVLRLWLAYVQNQTGLTPKRFHTDGGTEFTGGETRAVFEQHGIQFTTTSPHEPNMNAFSERINRTLMECALAMMFQAGASQVRILSSFRVQPELDSACDSREQSSSGEHLV